VAIVQEGQRRRARFCDTPAFSNLQASRLTSAAPDDPTGDGILAATRAQIEKK
jgi:hypothetical protein